MLTLAYTGSVEGPVPPLRVIALWTVAAVGRAPKREIYVQHPAVMWTGVVSDLLVAASYVILFACLAFIAARLSGLSGFKKNIGVVSAFGMLMVACGASRLVGVASVWWLLIPIVVLIKVLCALAAVPAAILFARATPALVSNVRTFVEMAAKTESQRDRAIFELAEWEVVVEERQRAAKEIASAYAQVSAAMEYTSDMVMTIAENWTLLYGNRKTLENVPDFRLGENYWDCFPEALGTISEEKLRGAMEERLPVRYENFYAPYAKWYRVQAFPTDEGLSVFFSDVTEDHTLREQLELEQILREKRIEALSHMAGGLAHEISNPLAIIHAKASDLKSSAESETTLPAGGVLEVCTSIVSTSERAMGILRGLRGFAREAGNDPMEWASIDTIVEQCVEIQESRYERHGVELRLRLEPEIPLLLCREVQIGQIITNLLNNAFDAIDQGECKERWVELCTREHGPELVVEVTDSGPGIADQFKAHLMEPFFTTKKASKGMGVGLSLSRAIAQDHRGSLTLCNGTRHTCFQLRLPLEPETPVGVGEAARQVAGEREVGSAAQ